MLRKTQCNQPVGSCLLSQRSSFPLNCSVCLHSGASLFSVTACSFFKVQLIPFKQKSHFLIKAGGRDQSGAIMHQTLWCLTFSCDYSSACILSWKSLEFCHLNMFFLASLTRLPYCNATHTFKLQLLLCLLSLLALLLSYFFLFGCFFLYNHLMCLSTARGVTLPLNIPETKELISRVNLFHDAL